MVLCGIELNEADRGHAVFASDGLGDHGASRDKLAKRIRARATLRKGGKFALGGCRDDVINKAGSSDCGGEIPSWFAYFAANGGD